MRASPGLAAAWVTLVVAAAGVRLWNALTGPLMWGYDAWGHVAYALFVDLYRGVPWADQGWSYFHPPLHYALGWALAQFGSGEVLMRGLMLLASAASLGTAALAAWLVRVALPGRDGLPLIGFAAVAFLPVHLFMSGMPGNELTETFLTAAAFCAFVAGERRRRPSLAGDAAVGGLVGLALLTKFSGLLPLLVVWASLALRWGLGSRRASDLRRAALRAAWIGGLALALAAPYYARNLAAFGTPFELSRGYPLVASVERDQPPGTRTWDHYLRIPSKLFSDPNPLAPHLIESVWGSVYLNFWADTYRESDVERALAVERQAQRPIRWMALLGLLPTGLAMAGFLALARGALAGERREVLLPLGVLTLAGLGAFAVFSWQVPIWSALKSSYLLSLSLPFAVSLARGSELAAARAGRTAVALPLAAVAAAAAAVGTVGVAYPRRADAPATGAVRFYFGEYEDARRVYGRLVAGSGYPVAWLENLAAVELADGRPDRARRLYARAAALADAAGRPDPYRPGRLAVATAAGGELREAREILDAALAADPRPELRANRGRIRAAVGDLAGARRDLEQAVSQAPEMTPAWLGLAEVLERLGRDPGEARAGAERAACRAPRGYPYGIGTGEVIEWGVGRRPLLVSQDGQLRAARPEFYRTVCRSLRAGRAASAKPGDAG